MLFDDTDDFLKFIAKLENELNTRVTSINCKIFVFDFGYFGVSEVYETSRGDRRDREDCARCADAR